jgi:hypothetical protein
VIILGPGRAGKTVLAYSSSHTGKTLGIESEEGVHSAADYIHGPNLEIETISKKVKNPKTGIWESLPWDKQPPVKERLKELVLKAFTGGYQNVVVDSLTDIAGKFEDEYARTGVPHQNDWYKITEGVKSFVRDLKNGPFNLIMTCIAVAPKEGSLVEVSLALPGQLKETIAPMFQSIILLKYEKKDKRWKLVVNDPSLGVCDRFHSFGKGIRDVDISNRPQWAMKTLMEGPKKLASTAGEGGTEEVSEEATTVAPVKKLAPVIRKIVSRPVFGRPLVKG